MAEDHREGRAGATINPVKIAHVRDRTAPIGTPWRLAAGLDGAGTRWMDLEAARAAGQTLDIQVLGLASIARDVTPELARATIASVTVLGALRASPAVKAALADRMT